MLLPIYDKDIIDIIFPATSCNEKQVNLISQYVTNYLNLTPRIPFEKHLNYNDVIDDNELPTFDDVIRFNQFKIAVENNDSKIIFCARGGYGSGDLLPMIDKMNKPKKPKIFIGFSDISSLTTFLQDKWNWKVIYGPNLLDLASFSINKEAGQELKDLIFGTKKEFSYDLKLINEIKKTNIESVICGGCLSVLTGHFGGAYELDFENKILILEDEGETGQRLDRYFRQIIELINYKKKLPKAIILGNFLKANRQGTPISKYVDISITRFHKRIADNNINIPVFISKNSDIGHGDNMRPLIFGSNAFIKKANDKDFILYQN